MKEKIFYSHYVPKGMRYVLKPGVDGTLVRENSKINKAFDEGYDRVKIINIKELDPRMAVEKL